MRISGRICESDEGENHPEYDTILTKLGATGLNASQVARRVATRRNFIVFKIRSKKFIRILAQT